MILKIKLQLDMQAKNPSSAFDFAQNTSYRANTGPEAYYQSGTLLVDVATTLNRL